MEPLHRTVSHGSQQSRRSSSGALSSPLLDHKAHYAEADHARLSSVAVKRASISMPLHMPTSLSQPLKSNPHRSPPSRRPSRAHSEHNLLTHILHQHMMASSGPPDSSAVIDDADATPTQTHNNSEPNLNLAVPRQDNDDSNRLSFSLYQLGSALYDRARGAVSTASSVAGSETDGASDFQLPLTRKNTQALKTLPTPRHCACAQPSQEKQPLALTFFLSAHSNQSKPQQDPTLLPSRCPPPCNINHTRRPPPPWTATMISRCPPLQNLPRPQPLQEPASLAPSLAKLPPLQTQTLAAELLNHEESAVAQSTAQARAQNVPNKTSLYPLARSAFALWTVRPEASPVATSLTD